MGGDDLCASAWASVPWWHPRRWFGYHMRREVWDDWSIGGRYDAQWEYATYAQVARMTIAEQFGSGR